MGLDVGLQVSTDTENYEVVLGRRYRYETDNDFDPFNEMLSKEQAIDFVKEIIKKKKKSLQYCEDEEDIEDVEYEITHLKSLDKFIKSLSDDSILRFSDDNDDVELEDKKEVDLASFIPKQTKLYTFVNDTSPSFVLFKTPEEALMNYINSQEWTDCGSTKSLEINGCIDQYILIEE